MDNEAAKQINIPEKRRVTPDLVGRQILVRDPEEESDRKRILKVTVSRFSPNGKYVELSAWEWDEEKRVGWVKLGVVEVLDVFPAKHLENSIDKRANYELAKAVPSEPPKRSWWKFWD